MQLFYTPQISGEFYTLPEEESKHCVRTLRKKEGDVIDLTDGKGSFYNAQITLANPKRCEIKILSTKVQEETAFKIEMAVAPTKNINRFEFFLEKATEIGIEGVTPLSCRFSERKNIKPERLKKILVSAMKQSQKAFKPYFGDLTKFEDFVKQEFTGQKFIAHCYSSPKQTLKSAYKPGSNALIMIGPEGDFSEKEVELAKENGFVEISLSEARLRTETAAIVACHTINLLN